MKFYKIELQHLLIADLVLSFAFVNIIGFTLENFIASFIAVTFGFAFHEIAHKLTAQHFGAVSYFQASPMGLIFSLLSSLLGFLVAIPGATIVVGHLSRKENGVVSLAGPMWNISVGLVFIILMVFYPSFSKIFSFVAFVNLLLAFFNLLPIYPMDGSKVLMWNKFVYFAVVGALFIFLLMLDLVSISSLIFMILFALIFSYFYNYL